jgi:hypothetical protein
MKLILGLILIIVLIGFKSIGKKNSVFIFPLIIPLLPIFPADLRRLKPQISADRLKNFSTNHKL